MSSSSPSSPPRPTASPPAGSAKPRRQAASRACDRCRRRKAKCDFDTAAGTCTHCRDNGARCAFDMPLAKRGPKSKKRAGSSIPLESVSTFSGRRELPQPQPPFGGRAGSVTATFASPSTSSVTSWEPTSQLGAAAAGLSPTATRDFSLASSAVANEISAVTRWRNLHRLFALRNKTLDHVVEQCFKAFFEYLYPLTPLVHEPSLRDGFALFKQQAGGALQQTSRRSTLDSASATLPDLNTTWPGISQEISAGPNGEVSNCWHDATFTLITAVCAEAAFLLPKDLFPEGESVADLLLQASRDCLNSYLEADLESPNANSVTIRYFHSNCVHAAGKPKYSWHIFGEATRLAQVMRLYDESSLEGLHPIEAELRRRAFWIVYMGDKSAAILNNRPITMHKYSFESGITTAYPTGLDNGAPSIGQQAHDVTTPPDTHAKNFIAGFNANLKLWQAASDLLIQVRLFQDQKATEFIGSSQPAQALTENERQHLDSLFVQFITCLDDLPPYLHSYTFAAVANNGAPTIEANQFVIQCANLQVSFHCLRMVITQKFEDIAFFAPGAEQADLRKTEIVRDMLRVMHEAPFWSLQVNGEPYVEKIRLIGATLLAIIHRNQASPLAARARGDFSVLLDILTRLDSKASDALKSTSTWAL